jgi:hypothetical protein
MSARKTIPRLRTKSFPRAPCARGDEGENTLVKTREVLVKTFRENFLRRHFTESRSTCKIEEGYRPKNEREKHHWNEIEEYG